MLTILLLIALLTLAAMYVALALKARQLGKDFKFLKDEMDQERDRHLRRELDYQEEILYLGDQLENAYTSLNLALGASPGPFNHVATELGVYGVVYQFDIKQKEQT